MKTKTRCLLAPFITRMPQEVIELVSVFMFFVVVVFLSISQELSLLCIINTSHFLPWLTTTHFSKYKNTEISTIAHIRHLSCGSAQLEPCSLCFNFTDGFAGVSGSLLTLISANYTDMTPPFTLTDKRHKDNKESQMM